MALPVILTAEVFYDHPRAHWRSLPAAMWCWEKHPVPPWRRAMIGPLPQLGETVDAPAGYAFVNHGMWRCACPFCGSNQVAAKRDRRFLCAGDSGCANARVGGAFVPVVWPDDVEEIEALLVQRPDVRTRNWSPGETVARLRGENAENGIGVAV